MNALTAGSSVSFAEQHLDEVAASLPAKGRGKGYPLREQVPAALRNWRNSYPGYAPTWHEDADVLRNDCTKNPQGWAHPQFVDGVQFAIFKADVEWHSFEGAIDFDLRTELPRNPRGRSNIAGRGLWGKWGPNFARDSLVTRVNPEARQLEMLAIKRMTGEWAMPGGMADRGEARLTTALRELAEETGVVLGDEPAELVYEGYVDDPRNTDNAWAETSVFHTHLDYEASLQHQPKAGSDAKAVAWLPVTEDLLRELYASHGEMVRMAITRRKLLHTEDLVFAQATVDLRHEPLLTCLQGLRGRIGIVGGTFDPVHEGHIAIGEETRRALGLDYVVFNPAAQNPLKELGAGATGYERMEMLRLALANNSRLFVCPLEIRRESPSYTAETLVSYRAAITDDAELTLILGADSAATLPRWEGVKSFKNLASVVAVVGDRHELPAELPYVNQILELPIPGYEATAIRRALATGEAPVRVEGVLPETAEYIEERGIYR